MNTRIAQSIPNEYYGWRLDQALADLLPEYSRARLQQWIKSGQLRLNDQIVKPHARLLGGEWLSGECHPEPVLTAKAQPLELDIVYQDEQLLVLNKPAGMVVHPAPGNPEGTLLNALLHHDPELVSLPRAGIVHRLDKDTSGLLVVARTLTAHKSLIEQLQARSVKRQYCAVVRGLLTTDGSVDAPIGRHPVDRKRMAVVPNGKPALTYYRIEQRYRSHTLLAVELASGRTHQIRVHMAHIRHPLLGDPVYGGRGRAAHLPQNFTRQALHAAKLGLVHPVAHETMLWQCPLPEDMQVLLNELQNDLDQ